MEITGFLSEGISSGVIDRPLKYQVKYGLARAQCILIRRDVLMRAGLFDEKLTMYEDQDLMCRLALEGPWGINTKELVYIYRRDEAIENLSIQRFKDAARCYEGLADAYKRLRENPKLRSNERHIVDAAIASYTTAAGMESLKNGQKESARYLLRHAIAEYPTVSGFFRYLLSFLPWQVTRELLDMWHKVRSMKTRPM